MLMDGPDGMGVITPILGEMVWWGDGVYLNALPPLPTLSFWVT